MESVPTGAQDRQDCVRTHDPGSGYHPRGCPICGQPLTGRKTVCSARCRAKRWRRAQQAAARQADQRAEVEQLRAEVERLRAQVAAHEERDRMSDAMFAGIAWYAGLARAKLAAA